jgi:peptidoglycan hydrolase-like protein with peptidoglycan-binding domain
VKSFQQSKGLTVDGIVGNQTWEALIITVQNGSTGDAVRAVQRQLNTRGYGLTVDGVFGSATTAGGARLPVPQRPVGGRDRRPQHVVQARRRHDQLSRRLSR